MEVDTGAAVTLMSEALYKRLWPGRDLKASRVHLKTYSGEAIPVVGGCNVNVTYQGQTAL